MDIYEPAEDSYLLQKEVQAHAEGRVLDLGTGSGIQGLAAIKSPRVREVLSVDINENAISELQKIIRQQKLRKIKVLKSNLFENITGKFNTIIFNPPYLPQDEGIEDAALYGGKKGWEVSEQFFHKASSHLISNGNILFLFSTLTNKEKVEEIIGHHLFQFKELSSEKMAWEKLYVYEITKTDLLRELEIKRVEEIHFLAKGKRGVIYKGIQERAELIKTHFAKKETISIAIKTKREDSQAMGRIENEVNWLKILNKKGIGPKLLFSSKTYFAYKFVEGALFLDWIETARKKEVLAVIKNLLNQCYIMDNIGVNKEEMHHPHKHIYITKNHRPVMIDFERCSRTENPKNVTQFVEFLARIKKDLKEFTYDPDKLRELAKEYKQSRDLEIIINFLL
ncbi:methyltransferase [Candidatus Woesearchaeota archaeon]|jgi:release factor glutamine methyltransferase|nr:methyltransferase [Candidatus Woesearchaeota archaeon]MBT4434519.1 methyltransferase [Candidatus Woesearchaeota archaeon]